MNENLNTITVFFLVFVTAVLSITAGWLIGNLFRDLTNFFKRTGEMLAWFEVAKELAKEKAEENTETGNQTGKVIPFPISAENSAANETVKKKDLPFWEDLEQLEEERLRLIEGSSEAGFIDPLDHARRVEEAIADLKDEATPSGKK